MSKIIINNKTNLTESEALTMVRDVLEQEPALNAVRNNHFLEEVIWGKRVYIVTMIKNTRSKQFRITDKI
jgi:hypothetical protein